jgi:lipoprotein signal peptidase
MVLAVVLRNLRLPGLVLVAAGALSNMLAIVANGGFMPASAAALAFLGKSVHPGYSNSAIVESPALAPLTDVFALPPFVPFANVFSIGDVLISIGIAVVIASAMRDGARGHLPTKYPSPGTTES